MNNIHVTIPSFNDVAPQFPSLIGCQSGSSQDGAVNQDCMAHGKLPRFITGVNMLFFLSENSLRKNMANLIRKNTEKHILVNRTPIIFELSTTAKNHFLQCTM